MKIFFKVSLLSKPPTRYLYSSDAQLVHAQGLRVQYHETKLCKIFSKNALTTNNHKKSLTSQRGSFCISEITNKNFPIFIILYAYIN